MSRRAEPGGHEPRADARAARDLMQLLVERSPIGQFVAGPDGRIVLANEAYARLLDRPLESLIGLGPADVVHPDDVDDVLEAGTRLFRGETETIVLETRHPMADGTLRWLRTTTNAVRDDDGRVAWLLTAVEDITDRRLAEEALAESEVRYETVLDALDEAIVVMDRGGTVVASNAASERVFGVSVEALRSIARADAPWQAYRPDGTPVPYDELPMLVTLRTGEPVVDAVLRLTNADGTVERWVSATALPLRRDGDALPYAVVGSFTDITQRRASEQVTERLALIAESTSDLVAIVDGDGNVSYMNRAARDAHGFADGDHAGVHVSALYTAEANERFYRDVLPQLLEGRTWSGELEMYGARGEVMHVWQTLAPDIGPAGDLRSISALGRDITDQKLAEAELAHQATHDALTGLPNRVLLLEHLEVALHRAARSGRQVAVLFLDLDRFKLVNDTYGHEAGDELLRRVAERLASTVRPFDVVARLGGDEFVIVCGEVDEQQAESIAVRVLRALERDEIPVDGATTAVAASIGIALSTGEGAHPEALLRDADAAMYRAKALGRGRFELYDETMRSRAVERQRLADELRRAVTEGELAVHYQLVFDLATGAPIGTEALVRWNHPERGLLVPGEFIAVAEETGLVIPLGDAAIGTACEQLRRWQDAYGDRAPTMHVNLSPRQLAASPVVDIVGGALSDARADPVGLCVEVVETALIDDASAAASLAALRELGIRIAIDDFGTGHSSLAHLRELPVDLVKIDQSFVQALGPDAENTAIVAAIVRLAQTLELGTIAEGVERHDQVDELRALGCDAAQGFLFARPLPAEAVTALLDAAVSA